MEGKRYTVYRVTLPSGNHYVGYTSMTVNEKMRWHMRRAMSGDSRPFYTELKTVGILKCRIEVLDMFKDRISAMKSLFRKNTMNETRKRNVTEVWAKRSGEERRAISNKISASHKRHNATLTAEERKLRTQRARENVDRRKQGAAASRGIKRFWEELKKDPERYAEFMRRRSETFHRNAARKRAANGANV